MKVFLRLPTQNFWFTKHIQGPGDKGHLQWVTLMFVPDDLIKAGKSEERKNILLCSCETGLFSFIYM